MDERRAELEMPERRSMFKGINWGLFLGFCVVAISIYLAGTRIAERIPHSLHGNLHGSFSGTLVDGGGGSRSEFMSEWEVASFLRMSHDEFERLVGRGELEGTYTVFTVERTVMRVPTVDGARDVQVHGGIVERPIFIEYETITVDQRVFSRERVYEWLMARIDG